jgi:uncharacterized protein YndB with AHSA1/START domain
MATVTRSITIDAPVETVFGIALDLSKLWKFEDIAVANVDSKPGGVGTSAEVWTHFLGFHLAGKAEYTEVVPGEKVVIKVHFFAENPTWTFTFAPADGGTTLTAVGEWHVKAPIVGKPYESMMAKEHEPFVEQLLANVKQQAEALQAA